MVSVQVENAIKSMGRKQFVELLYYGTAGVCNGSLVRLNTGGLWLLTDEAFGNTTMVTYDEFLSIYRGDI